MCFSQNVESEHIKIYIPKHTENKGNYAVTAALRDIFPRSCEGAEQLPIKNKTVMAVLTVITVI